MSRQSTPGVPFRENCRRQATEGVKPRHPLAVTALVLILSVLIVVLGVMGQNAVIAYDNAPQPLPGEGTQSEEIFLSHPPAGILGLTADYDAAGSPVGYTVKTAAEGYGGRVVVAVKIAENLKTLRGVTVLSHNETHYVGDQIEKPFFLEQFVAKKLPLKSSATRGRGASIDLISGATRSSTAVLTTVNEAYRFLQTR